MSQSTSACPLLLLVLLRGILLCSSGLLLPNIGEKAVTHAKTGAEVTEWLEEHVSVPCVLGFDTETRPSFVKGRLNPPAVVQLSTMDACLVAQIFVAENKRVGSKNNRQTVAIPLEEREGAEGVRDALEETLESRNIIKAGVGIDDDAIDLWQFWGLEMNARLDLAGDERPPRGLAYLLHASME